MKIINRKTIKPFTTLDNSQIRELASHRNTKLKGLSLAEAVVLPGRETFLHIHKTSQEVYYILDGRGRMCIEKDSKVVKKGDTITILPGKKHKML